MSRRPPNLLFLTAHDAGTHFGCYGIESVQSPAIDRLAATSCLFRQHFCVSPVCSPSRGTLMTGRYPQSNGLMGLTQTPFRWRFNPGARHLAQILREAGYHAVLFHHQHETGLDEWPALGFHEARVLESGRIGLPPEQRFPAASEVAAAVAEFLRERTEQATPFFAQVGFHETHTPYEFGGAAPDEANGVWIPPSLVVNERSRRHMAALQGAVRGLDQAMGRILDALERNGLAANTIVVFTADHGIEVPHGKWECYDPGLRVALLLRWPEGGLGGGRTCEWLSSHVDVVPTLLELIGLPLPSRQEGRSLASWFRDPQAPTVRDAVFAMMHHHDRFNETRCIRTRRHKLIRSFSPSRFQVVPVDLSRPRVEERPVIELYDLEQDPCETRNLAREPEHNEIGSELNRRLQRWLQKVNDPILRGPMPTPYYKMAREADPS